MHLPKSMWHDTRMALLSLEQLLKCDKCASASATCSIAPCEHLYCQSGNCTVCKASANQKNFVFHEVLSSTVELCNQLKQTLVVDNVTQEDRNRKENEPERKPAACDTVEPVADPVESRAAIKQKKRQHKNAKKAAEFKVECSDDKHDKKCGDNDDNRTTLIDSGRNSSMTNEGRGPLRKVRSSIGRSRLAQSGLKSTTESSLDDQPPPKPTTSTTENVKVKRSLRKRPSDQIAEESSAKLKRTDGDSDRSGQNEDSSVVDVKSPGTSSALLKTTRVTLERLKDRESASNRSSESGTNKKQPFSPASQKRNKKGETALHIAAIKNDLAMARRVLDAGAPIEAKDYAGWTPLHEACNHGHKVVAELLLDRGAAINVTGADMMTPLHDAVHNEREDVVKMLCRRGADKSKKNKFGLTAADLCTTDVIREALATPIEADLLEQTVLESPGDAEDRAVVIMTSGLNRDEKNKVKEIAEKLGGMAVDCYNAEVTHLVTTVNNEKHCQRTLKFLQAVAAGIWVVSPDWLWNCMKSNSNVGETDFELPGSTNNPLSYSPLRSRSNREDKFYFHGNYPPSLPNKSALSDLVRIAGGEILTREPRRDLLLNKALSDMPFHIAAESPLAKCRCFVICAEIKGWSLDSDGRIARLSPYWLLNSISTFTIVDPNSMVS